MITGEESIRHRLSGFYSRNSDLKEIYDVAIDEAQMLEMKIEVVDKSDSEFVQKKFIFVLRLESRN